MPTSSQRQTKKYRVVVQELHTWTEYPTSEELKAPRSQDAPEPPTQTDREAWVQTDIIETDRKPTIVAYLRGLADELSPEPKDMKVYRSHA